MVAKCCQAIASAVYRDGGTRHRLGATLTKKWSMSTFPWQVDDAYPDQPEEAETLNFQRFWVLTSADLLSMSHRKDLKSERCHLSPCTFHWPCLASTLADPRRYRPQKAEQCEQESTAVCGAQEGPFVIFPQGPRLLCCLPPMLVDFWYFEHYITVYRNIYIYIHRNI